MKLKILSHHHQCSYIHFAVEPLNLNGGGVVNGKYVSNYQVHLVHGLLLLYLQIKIKIRIRDPMI